MTSLICISLLSHAGLSAPAPVVPAATPSPLVSTASGQALFAAIKGAQFQFTPEVEASFLKFGRSEAEAKLAARGQKLPKDFLDWVDSDATVAATIYGMPQPSEDMLSVLYSLEIDLGKETVRKDYTQLALAMAVCHSQMGATADLTPRPLLNLVIPQNPLEPVDTKDPNRELDVDDHVINFLKENPVTYTTKVQPTHMVEVKNPTDASKPLMKEVPDPKATAKEETHTRELLAWEVMASKELQAKFNAYMKAKGQTVEINCETPRRGTIPSADRAAILQATAIFRKAYIAKGLLLEKRDATPSLAEFCAFLIRNDKYRFPADVKRAWPLFPLKAPWPVLTYLALNRTPLREADDLWNRYVSTGRVYTYGNYVGNIAQHSALLQARSMAPFDYGYGSVQMMLKDGGVCGTMAGISAHNKVVLGRPACTAGQPGHCALVVFRDIGKGLFDLKGEQFVTGGNRQTTPHSPWIFNASRGRRGMGDHETVAWMVNYSFPTFLQSQIASNIIRLLGENASVDERMSMALSGLALNPYNLTLVETARATVGADPVLNFTLWKALDANLQKGTKPGCPVESIYSGKVKGQVLNVLAASPAPTDKKQAEEIYQFLKAEKTPHAGALARYQTAVEGLGPMIQRIDKELGEYLAQPRTPANANIMASSLNAAAAQIADPAERKSWARKCVERLQSEPSYFSKNRITTDAAYATAVKLSGEKLPAPPLLIQPLLDSLAAELQADIKSPVVPKNAKDGRTAAMRNLTRNEITAAVTQIRNLEQRDQWRSQLFQIMGDLPEYENFKRNLLQVEWKVTEVSLQSNQGRKQAQRGNATYAIDSNPETAWHTSFGDDNKGQPPHHIVVDMGRERTLAGFTYLPRIKQEIGMVDACAFSISTDGKTWSLAADVKFDDLLSKSAETGKAEQRVPFEPIKARYFKFEAKHVLAGNHLVVPEIGVIFEQ